LKAKLLQLSKKPFVRNVATVATGTAAAQAIGIAFSPLITRLYGPEAFGLLGTFMALVAVLTPIAALCYPIAIVLPKKDEDAKALVKLSIYISLGIALLVTLLLLIGGDWLLALVGAEAISAFKFLIPLNLLFAAWLQIAQQWLIRKKQFKVKAKAAVAQAAVVNGVKTGIGVFHPLAAVLIVMSSLGKIFHAGLLYLGLKYNKSLPNSFNSEENTSIKTVARRHRDFPLFRAPQVFINAASQGLPVLMLAAFFGPAPAGFFTLGKKILGTPTRLIGQSVRDVFYPKISEAAQRGESLSKLIFMATLYMAAIGIIPFAIITLFGPWLFGFVFGSEWTVAGEYARWLSIMLFFQYINRPAVAAIPVIGIQKGLLFYEFFSTGSKLIVLYIGFVIFMNDVFSIAAFSIAGALAYISLILWVLASAKKRNKKSC